MRSGIVMDSTQPTSDKYITHLVWEDDEDESLCGLDVSETNWEGIVVRWCPKCANVDRFLNVFESFNASYDVKTSLEATIETIKNAKAIESLMNLDLRGVVA